MASARYPGDPWFEELIEDLKQVSPEFCRRWPLHDVRSALDGHKVIEHPMLGSLEFEHFTLRVLTNPDIRIMIYTLNAVTRTTLQRFLEGPTANRIPALQRISRGRSRRRSARGLARSGSVACCL